MKAIHGPVEIFACYAREDEALLNELEKHLSSLQRENMIEFWHDRKINPGANWKQEIQEHLHAAHIILFLVSSDFIHSDYCYSIEMQQAMQRHHSGNVCIIPIILRPVSWQNTPFGKLQALPADAKPIIGPDWPNSEVAFNNVAEDIRKMVMELKGKRTTTASLKTRTVATMRQFTTPPVSTVTLAPLSTSSSRSSFSQPIQTRLRKRPSSLSIASIVVLVFALILMGINAHVLFSGSNTNAQNNQTPQQTTSHGQTSVPSTPTPTLSPTPTYQAGQLIYEVKDWSTWSGSPQWKSTSSGIYGSDGTDTENSPDAFTAWVPNPLPVVDYAVEAQITFVRSKDRFGQYHFGIMVRGDGQSNGYEVGIALEGQPNPADGNYCEKPQPTATAFISLIQGIQTPIGYGFCMAFATLAKTEYAFDTQSHLFRVEVEGDTITLFLDHHRVLSTSDNTYINAGQVGLRSVFADVNVTSFKVFAL